MMDKKTTGSKLLGNKYPTNHHFCAKRITNNLPHGIIISAPFDLDVFTFPLLVSFPDFL